MAEPIVYLNGHTMPLSEAKISVMDRGFLFGDGVYEVIPAYNGQLFCAQQHLQRLVRSLEAIRLPITLNIEEWIYWLKELLNKNGGGTQSIYLQITRGPEETRAHRFPRDPKPTVFARTTPFTPPTIETLRKGISAITSTDTRWEQCYIKSISLLPNILLQQQAIDVGAEETILIRQGHAIEATSSNLWLVHDNTLITPPKTSHILGGITRDFILQLAKQHQIACAERAIQADELFTADEIWISSSTREIKPVIKLDNHSVGTGQAGPVWENMIRLYKDAVAA